MIHKKLRFHISLLFCSFLFLCNIAQSQSGPSKAILNKTVLTKEKDLIDVYNTMFNKTRKDDSSTKHDPWKFHKAFVPAAGYTLQTGWAGIVAANVGFYTTSDTCAKLSNFITSITYSQYDQTILPFQANIWTKKDRYNINIDWRYLDYPSSTYGLGGHTELSNGYTIDFSYLKLHQSIVREVTKDLLLGIGYYYDYLWNVKEVNPPTGVGAKETSFERYDANGGIVKNRSTASGITYKAQFDDRHNQINPDNGWYAAAQYRTNYTWMGSDNNWQSLQVDIRKYFNFPVGSKNVLALWNLDWITPAGKPPYLLLPSTGWDDYYNTGRGYIQGRYRAKQFIYFESEYRFKVSPSGLLGGVIFINSQSFSSTVSKELQSNAIGYVAGLRIKLNRLTGANLCIDYGFGTDGSRGFFVNLGEVF